MLLGSGIRLRDRSRPRAQGHRAPRWPVPCSAIAAISARSPPTAAPRCSTTTNPSTPPPWCPCLAGSPGPATWPRPPQRRRPALPGRPRRRARLDFDAKAAPPLPEGWTRAFILRFIGYCKDADPFTAASDTVGPLPGGRCPHSRSAPKASGRSTRRIGSTSAATRPARRGANISPVPRFSSVVDCRVESDHTSYRHRRIQPRCRTKMAGKKEVRKSQYRPTGRRTGCHDPRIAIQGRKARGVWNGESTARIGTQIRQRI